MTPQRQKHISQWVATLWTRSCPCRPGGRTGAAFAVAAAAAPAPVAATVPRKRRLETLSLIAHHSRQPIELPVRGR